MGELVDKLGNKVAGQLIRSQDWNALVAEIEKMETALNGRIDQLKSSLEARISGVEQQLVPLQSELDSLREEINPLIGKFYQLTLETTKLDYAIGQQAEIIARVTDLQGQPLGIRPWVDFFTHWGQLKPVPGFESRGGTTGHTISVRTNQQGEARVLLRSEFVEGISDLEEDEVSVTLTSSLPASGLTIADAILSSNTPVEAKNVGAFRILAQEYDRADAPVRRYVDMHYVRNPILIRPPSHSWRDYRSTVLASVKDDSDPRTPDQSRGVSSLQVRFRDWIRPWILDYIVDTGTLVQNFRDRLVPKITSRFQESILNLKTEVNEFVHDKGLVGRQRGYHVMRQALDEVTVSQPPVFLNTLTKSLQDAISIQQSLDIAQSRTVDSGEQEIGFEVFTNVDARADSNLNEIRGKVDALEINIAQVNQAVDQKVSQVVAARVEELDRPGGKFDGLRQDIERVSGQVLAVEQLGDVQEVKNRLSLIADVGTASMP